MKDAYPKQYYRAYERGYNDFIERRVMFISENPYTKDDPKSRAWAAGYKDADSYELSSDRQYDEYGLDAY